MTESDSRTHCRNCNARLQGEYCHECGQSAKVVRRPTMDLLQDVTSHLLQWDGRIFQTLTFLFSKPGQLSLDWVEGKRSRYVPPFRLYIIASFFLFLLFGFSGQGVELTHDSSIVQSNESSTELTQAIKQAEDDGNRMTALFLTGVNDAISDPSAYLSKIKRNLPKAAFLLLPVFGLLHHLIEVRKSRYLIDYLVFSLHFHAFAFALLSMILLCGIIYQPLGNFAQLLTLAIPVYACLGIKRFNPQTLLKSILKTGLLLGAYTIILGLITGMYFLLVLFI